MNGLKVRKPGMLSLLQDAGRYGQHAIGLTTGGPLDAYAMGWANRLVGNTPGTTAVEASFGGLELEATQSILVAVCGGDAQLQLNGEPADTWRSHQLHAGDSLAFGYATHFCRSYIAVAGGIHVKTQFGSSATVVREGIGGIDGRKLDAGDLLPCASSSNQSCKSVPDSERAAYSRDIEMRVVPGYQWSHFSALQRRRFFSAVYQVTDRADRMGYRLDGPAIACDIDGILSEGICQGAIQIPADGQPIVLLNDRQTIGGYPKIGSALSLDCARLGQLMPGSSVRFCEISEHEAHNALQLAHARFARATAQSCPA